MKKWLKILLGLATLWPFVYMIIFFVVIISTLIFMPNQEAEGSGPPMFFAVIIPLHLLTMLWIIALTIFYIVNVFKNDLVDKAKKVLWAVVIFMGSLIAMPIYWYLYIWRESAVAGSPPPPPLGSADASGYLGAQANREHQYVPPAQPPNWRE